MRFVAVFDAVGRPVALFSYDGLDAAVLTPTGWKSAPLDTYAQACVTGVEVDSEDARLVGLILDCPGLIPVAA